MFRVLKLEPAIYQNDKKSQDVVMLSKDMLIGQQDEHSPVPVHGSTDCKDLPCKEPNLQPLDRPATGNGEFYFLQCTTDSTT